MKPPRLSTRKTTGVIASYSMTDIERKRAEASATAALLIALTVGAAAAALTVYALSRFLLHQ